MPVSVVISYCSKEHFFLEPILEQCSKFSDDIVVSFGSHLYNGTPEDISYIHEVAPKFQHVKFVQYLVSPDNFNGMGVHKRQQAYWHNMARWNGVMHLQYHDWVLLLDADEIPEGEKFKNWFSSVEGTPILNNKTTFKIANYWYFKDPTNRALVLEDSVLLIHAKYLSKYNIFGDYERDYTIQQSGTRLIRQTRGIKGEVMFHHFSWVRSREGLEHKIRHWGHADEYNNPEHVINEIFKNDNVNDIIHHYNYEKVPNHFNIQMS
jgi:hypothetical protein